MSRRRPAGQRNKLVIIQRATATKDAYGEPINSWSEIGRVLAGMIHGRGDERRQAAMEQGMQPATFQMLATSVTRSLRLRDRLIAEGVVWDVRGVVVDSPMRGSVEVEAVANPEIAA
jgi:head-tail adaptor